MNARIGIDGRAAAAMVMLCAIWGMQQVAIKAAEPDVSAVLQIAIRSGLAALGFTCWRAAAASASPGIVPR